MEPGHTAFTRRGVLRAGMTGVGALGALTAAACTVGGGGAPPPTEVQGTVVWSTRVNPEENNWQTQAVIPKLKEKFPKINLSIETAPANEWAVKLVGLYAAGTPPDIH